MLLDRKIADNIIGPLGRYSLMVKDVFKDITSKGVNPKDLIKQIVRMGYDSLPIVILTAIFTGMVLALQTAYGLQRFGAKNYVGNVVGLGLVRELGPVLTAVMLCGRVGAGIAAEIASMVVTEQVDALRALGANPIRKLVSPKITAAVIVVPMLVSCATAIGIYGGLLVGVYELGISSYTYYRSLIYTLVIRDYVDAQVKSAIFGFLLVSICCYKGLRTRGGTEGVGLTTTEAVVTSSIVIFVSDFFITKLLIMLS